MGFLLGLLYVLLVVVSLFLCFIILIQDSKSGGLSTAFGGSCGGPPSVQCCVDAEPPCSVDGAPGLCLPVDACAAPFVTTAGLCPGDASVQCCTDPATACDPGVMPTPNDGLAWYNLGNLQRDQFADPRAALESFRNAVGYRPLMGEAHFNLGLTLLDLERPAEALASIERAIELAAPTAEWRERAIDVQTVARFLVERGGP